MHTLSMNGTNSSLISTGVGDVDGTQFFVNNGAQIEIRNITEITQPNSNHRFLAQVRDHESEFSFPNLTTINGATDGHDLYIHALTGGQLNLPKLDPN